MTVVPSSPMSAPLGGNRRFVEGERLLSKGPARWLQDEGLATQLSLPGSLNGLSGAGMPGTVWLLSAP